MDFTETISVINRIPRMYVPQKISQASTPPRFAVK